MDRTEIPTQTVIITGATSGLGYHCAKAIAQSQHNWHIMIASRNPEKIDRAVEKLKRETSRNNIQGMVLDLASLTSVRQFVGQFIALETPPLQAIVCNAGIQIVSGTEYTRDGLEMTFGVNHLGHFLLVNLLLPHLSNNSRIVFVSSDTHDRAKNTGMPAPEYQKAELLAFPKESPDANMGHIGRTRYTTSKLCNLFCAYELARRSQEKGLKCTSNAFNPSLMLDTQLARDYSLRQILSLFFDKFPSFFKLLLSRRDSQNMGVALAQLILDPALEGVTGQYFDGFDRIDSSPESRDREIARELWEASADLVKLTPAEQLL